MNVQEKERRPRSTCRCAKLLIVDDNPHNVFVLRGYAKSMEVLSDEVPLRTHQQNRRQTDRRLCE